VTAARVQSAATKTANVHRSRKPACDERAAAQDRDQDGSVQKKIFHPLGPQASRLLFGTGF